MKQVCIESPYHPSDDDARRFAGRFSRGELLRQNLIYARMAVLDALKRNEAPFAAHLLYTQVWSEDDALRERGIRAGVEYLRTADLVMLYVDLGISDGMALARDNARLYGIQIGQRNLIGASTIDEAREHLAAQHLEPVFPYLDELMPPDASMGRIRL